MKTLKNNRPVLLSMLEEHFAGTSEFLAQLRTTEMLPTQLWEPALLAPVRDFLSRPGKEFRARLVATCWALASGNRTADARPMPPALPMVVELLHAGSLIVDDIQDDSRTRRGEPALHHTYGVPLAINAGCWLYFWSLSLLGEILSDLVSAELQAELLQRANRAMLHCHQGQALDLATRVYAIAPAELPRAVMATTSLKTGVLMELAAFIGARSTGAARERCAAIGSFGRQVGVGLQMLDDLGGVLAQERRHKAVEDLLLARLTWPWAWLVQFAQQSSRDSAATLRMWQLRAQAIVEASDREAALSLIVDLAEAIGPMGRAHIAAHLASAFADLRAQIGESVHLRAIESELQRLEKSYG